MIVASAFLPSMRGNLSPAGGRKELHWETKKRCQEVKQASRVNAKNSDSRSEKVKKKRVIFIHQNNYFVSPALYCFPTGSPAHQVTACINPFQKYTTEKCDPGYPRHLLHRLEPSTGTLAVGVIFFTCATFLVASNSGGVLYSLLLLLLFPLLPFSFFI